MRWLPLLVVLTSLPTLAAAQGSGGPDAFGYSYFGVELDFIELDAGLGAALSVSDGGTTAVPLPWDFPFYGVAYDTAYVNARGALSFGAAQPISGNNTCLSSSSATSLPDIAIFWDALTVAYGGDVYSWHDTAADRFVISWEAVERNLNTDGAWFQIHLRPSGTIEFHYEWTGYDATSWIWGASASIGIADWTGGTSASGNRLSMGCNHDTVARSTYAYRITACVDADEDGFEDVNCGGFDCDDADAAVHPGAPELCNSRDDDCSGSWFSQETIDHDGDGVTICAGDCDDGDGSISPLATEACDGTDRDCDGVVDDGFDGDGDGVSSCAGDCDDADPAVLPGAAEACDGVDTDCDGVVSGAGVYGATNLGSSATFGWPQASGVLWRVDEGVVFDRGQAQVGVAAGETLTWQLWEGSSDAGPWTLLRQASQVQTVSSATTWRDGPSMPALLEPGRWYVLAWHYGGSGSVGVRWSNQADIPQVAWFGQAMGSASLPAGGSPPTSVSSTATWSAAPLIRLATTAEVDGDGDGWTNCFDCADGDPSISPDAAEQCDGVDNDCDGTDAAVAEVDGDGDGFRICEGDCDDGAAATYPGAPESCDGVDTDCDGLHGADELADGDGDGEPSCSDCEPDDPAIFPGQTETCTGFDDNCDGVLAADEGVDGDGDGAPLCLDCDDADGQRWPGAPEQCDGIDNDCDAAVPGDELDGDSDGSAPCAGDCDDGDAAVGPGAIEVCDGIDGNCDGSLPANEQDGDGDGVSLCAGDCDDGDAARAPGLGEVCDGQDNNCDGAVPTDELDGDGDGEAACEGDCADDDPSRNTAAAEVCDGADGDCDGVVPPDERDVDGDGVAPCQGDCDDGELATWPGAAEQCDGADNDCDGALPPGELDADGDGYRGCSGDCDDGSPAVHPGAAEAGAATCADGLDNDCDLATDGDDSGCLPFGDDDDAGDDDVGDDDVGDDDAGDDDAGDDDIGDDDAGDDDAGDDDVGDDDDLADDDSTGDDDAGDDDAGDDDAGDDDAGDDDAGDDDASDDDAGDDDTGGMRFEGDEPGECDDGADNDQDGFFDCADPDCLGAPVCSGDDDDAGGSPRGAGCRGSLGATPGSRSFGWAWILVPPALRRRRS